MEESKCLNVWWDTETTGTDTAIAHIVEIAVHVDQQWLTRNHPNWRSQEWATMSPLSYSSLVKLPKGAAPIPKEASDVNHITQAMLEKAPEAYVVVCNILTMFRSLRSLLGVQYIVMTAHNGIPFDKPLLMKMLREAGDMKLPDFILFGDSIPIFRDHFGFKERGRWSLKFIAELRVPVNEYCELRKKSHRADGDCQTLAKVVEHCKDVDLFYSTLYNSLTQTTA